MLDEWLAEHGEGTACVVARAGAEPRLGGAYERVRVLTPVLAEGLEFDLVVLIEPESSGEGVEGAVDRYVAMTRATQRLVVLAGG